MGNKTTVNTSIWTGGNQESFLIHVISALNYCVRTKLFDKWRSAKSKKDAHQNDLLEIQNFILMLYDKQNKPAPMQAKKKVPEAQETMSKKTLDRTTMAKKKSKEGTTNTPVPTEIGPKQLICRS